MIIFEGGIPFKFPSELITGYNPLLHPQGEFELHVAEVKQAKIDCAARNQKHFPTVNETKKQNQNS
jgi:hypothetical protein